MAVATSLRLIDGICCIYDPNNIKVKDSDKIPCKDTNSFCVNLKETIPYQYKRTASSWARELRAHNFLYELGLFVSHTVDTDLNEDEPWYRLLAYAILSGIYWVYSWIKRW